SARELAARFHGKPVRALDGWNEIRGAVRAAAEMECAETSGRAPTPGHQYDPSPLRGGPGKTGRGDAPRPPGRRGPPLDSSIRRIWSVTARWDRKDAGRGGARRGPAAGRGRMGVRPRSGSPQANADVFLPADSPAKLAFPTRGHGGT